MAEIGSGTWRSIGNAPTDFVSLPFNAFLNGGLHWSKFSLRGEFINFFDFDTEQFGIVPPPHHFQELDRYSSGCTKTGVLGGCLFICHCPDFMQFDIWVMKEYGVKESWTKQFVLKHVYSGSYQPMLVLSNGEIFMLSNYPKITCYNQKGIYMRGAKSFRIRLKFHAISYMLCFSLQCCKRRANFQFYVGCRGPESMTRSVNEHIYMQDLIHET
ncbi:F-box protein At3g07870-like [Gossypium arboreum]|uniref:F-box protein At3g07870-like n=1 Tax=Gossypium arboreum TaxID=29729 RepID=UPI0022F1B5A4|nr:F-box protein At3g07870-like [Gossypium arboreum]